MGEEGSMELLHAQPAEEIHGASDSRSRGSRVLADRLVGDLWCEYNTTRSPEVRGRLVLHYSPLVKFTVDRMAGWPQRVDRADLASYGLFGLIDAIEKFDPGRGFKFETYAISRIRGAILDELRLIDWVPRSVRAKARAIERAYSKLENELRRSPDDAEVAAELGMTDGELAQTLSQVSLNGLVALDDLLTSSSGDRTGSATIGDTIADPQYDPAEAFETDEMKHLLADAIGRMPDRDRLVLTFYYYEGLTLAEIGGILGVTESRVCQIHTKALARLRQQFARSDGTRERVSA
jgi:RNA polymerase sigma factor for flagellar operon FliA